jgi:hypothetical protein
MDPVLDETSLVPCAAWMPAKRIGQLATTLKSLDGLGVPRVLRSVRDAPDTEISGGHGLRFWCFHRDVDRDSGRFVAQRLAQQPYIDGADGLFAGAEGNRAVEATVNGVRVIALGLAALEDHVVVAVGAAQRPEGRIERIHLIEYDGDVERSSNVQVPSLVLASDVEAGRDYIRTRLASTVSNGANLVSRLPDLFPRLLLGPTARAQFEAMHGAEPVFRQLIRHLRALDTAAQYWHPGNTFEPAGITYSEESNATLQHGRYGPMRDFSSPNGYAARRWSLHTKLTGGAGARMYFAVEPANETATVLIGYFGPHLRIATG